MTDTVRTELGDIVLGETMVQITDDCAKNMPPMHNLTLGKGYIVIDYGQFPKTETEWLRYKDDSDKIKDLATFNFKLYLGD
ncbi:hypothetical protein HOC01_01855 [archaeon]|jgi:hypothetical protein|nr:hypothetical protein [archaeon]MBT6697935.1 hypothetical protein [archaeon]